MAKVTIELGDEIELVAGNSRFTIGRLRAASVIDVQRDQGYRILTPEQRVEIPGPVVACSVRLDFDVMAGHFELTPAETAGTIPPAVGVEPQGNTTKHVIEHT